MYLPLPVLAAIAIAFFILLALAFRRRDGDRDLIAPPRAGTPAAWPSSGPGGSDRPSLPPEVEAEVRALCASGKKIAAIKRLRAATGLGLAEAKGWVERL